MFINAQTFSTVIVSFKIFRINDTPQTLCICALYSFNEPSGICFPFRLRLNDICFKNRHIVAVDTLKLKSNFQTASPPTYTIHPNTNKDVHPTAVEQTERASDRCRAFSNEFLLFSIDLSTNVATIAS